MGGHSFGYNIAKSSVRRGAVFTKRLMSRDYIHQVTIFTSMKKVAYLLVLWLLVLACQGGIKQTKEIIVYGSDNCHHCVDFKAQLDSVGFTYDFRDVEFNEFMNNEMVSKVRASGVQGGFKYPVIDVEGKILVAPKLGQVLELMKL